MKIAFIGGTRYGQPLDETSRKKFRAVSELGELFVIGFSEDVRPRRFSEYARFYLLPRWPVPVLRYVTMLAAGPLLALWVIVRHGVSVLVAQSPYEGFAAALAKTAARWAGRRVSLVVENHGDFEVSLFLHRRVGLPRVYRFLMGRAASLALRNADALRAISGCTRAQLERWAQGKPIHRFPAWTDIDVFLAAGQDSEREWRRFGEILYVGVLIPGKGVHLLVEAFARVADEFPAARVNIVGKVENREYARSLKAQVCKLGLDRRVEFLGAMPQAELAKRMASACVLVLPSLSEGLGRVVFEAMACGTPVIGSRVDGIPEMIEDGVTGFLVPPADVDALAERLRRVLRDPEQARRMGRSGRDFARRFFSADSYVQSYARVFQVAAGAGGEA